MIRTDAPVQTDKFDYDDDEQLAIHEFASRHIFGDWYLACTKSESARIYALLVDSDELAGLQQLAADGKRRGLDYPPLARYLRELESRQIAFPSSERPAVPQMRFLRHLPDEDVVVALSPFVMIRPMDRRYKQEILAVNYVNGRFARWRGRERKQLYALAEKPMSVPLSKKLSRQKLEKLHKFGLVTVLD